MKKFLYIAFLFFLVSQSVSGQRFYRVERIPVSTRGYDEIAPFPHKDGLVYLSNRQTGSFMEYKDGENRPFSDIYYVEWNGERDWGTPKQITSIKTNYADGPVSFANNNELMCFSRMYISETGDAGRRGNPNAGIFFADLNGDEWANIRAFEQNDPQYTLYSPFITPDGSSLYFAANFEDSRGGFDIYVSKKINGNWSAPQNMGDKVNTPEDDVYPYLHSSGRLYFSSKGHDAIGGSDVWYCDKFLDEWSDAVKLPGPINSAADDYTLIMNDDYSEGFFTSKRSGGSGDIYRFYTVFPTFELPRPIQRNRWKYRLRENSLDTIDYEIFSYEWVINDTLRLPGHEVIYAFPRPGDYELSFNVTNKVTDTVMYGVGTLFIPIRLIEQPVIVSVDTVAVNEVINFSARDTHLPNFNIEGYYWDFGDGMKSDGITTTHTFTFPGVYKVVLGIQERVRSRKFEPETIAVFKEITVIPAQ
ncbi:PKD domain-containing protein [Bacteroidota bacterium]